MACSVDITGSHRKMREELQILWLVYIYQFPNRKSVLRTLNPPEHHLQTDVRD